NPDVPQPIPFFDTWQEVPGLGVYDNGFKTEWEVFIRHLYEDAPFKWTLLEGAKGLQLVEAAHKSWKERRWIDIPALKVGGWISASRPGRAERDPGPIKTLSRRAAHAPFLLGPGAAL